MYLTRLGNAITHLKLLMIENREERNLVGAGLKILSIINDDRVNPPLLSFFKNQIGILYIKSITNHK